jgi:hypothetical protein
VKLKKGVLIRTGSGALCLVTKVSGSIVFGHWMTKAYLDIANNVAAFDDKDRDGYYAEKTTEEDAHYFLKNVFELFEKGCVRTAIT